MSRLDHSAIAVRTCRRCGESKPSSAFTTDRGLSTTLCIECNRLVCRERYAADPERFKAAARASRAARRARGVDVAGEDSERYWEKKKRDPIGYTLARLRRAAKAKGVPFDLERDDVFIPSHCPILGIPLRAIGTGHGTEDTVHADRLIPEIGYVRGNVAFISCRANRLKNDGSAEEHERIAAWMRSRGAG